MPSITSFSFLDAQATPVTHTFVPLRTDPDGTFWWEDTSAGTPAGFNRLSCKIVRKADLRSEDKVRVEYGFHTPVLESVAPSSNGFTPAPKAAYVCQSYVTFLIPARSSLQARKDIRKYVASLLELPPVKQTIEDMLGWY